MFLDVGQDDVTGAGDMRAVHSCWSCNYSEDDKAWSRPLKTDGQSLLRRIADRLRGVEIPMRYDRGDG